MTTTPARGAIRAQLTDADKDLLRAARACIGVVLGDATAEAASNVKAFGLASLGIRGSVPNSRAGHRVRAELTEPERQKLTDASRLINEVLVEEPTQAVAMRLNALDVHRQRNTRAATAGGAR